MAHFADEVSFIAISGKGGDGCTSFRREKYIAKGGPDGGDGGNGGNVILKVNPHLNTLSHLRNKKYQKAQAGRPGEGQKKHGANGEDHIIEVPMGTLVFDISDEEKRPLIDMKEPHEEFVLATGGRGGYGNAHFVSATRQAPDFAEIGDIPETTEVTLELKLIADVGIIGLPSAGKSTLISVISNARPKIAEYEFTTLIPNLGVVDHKGYSFVVSDIPGLIEGAAEGKGLGHQFLRHIERSALLIHLLDGSHLDEVVEDYKVIQKELEKYSKQLTAKRQVVVINKIDVLDHELISLLKEKLVQEANLKNEEIFAISAATHEGTEALLDFLLPLVKAHKEEMLLEEQQEHEEKTVVIHKPLEEDPQRCWLERDGEGNVIVRGQRIEQIVRMSNTDHPGALARIFDVLEKKGVDNELARLGLLEGDPFYIAGKKFEFEEKL